MKTELLAVLNIHDCLTTTCVRCYYITPAISHQNYLCKRSVKFANKNWTINPLIAIDPKHQLSKYVKWITRLLLQNKLITVRKALLTKPFVGVTSRMTENRLRKPYTKTTLLLPLHQLCFAFSHSLICSCPSCILVVVVVAITLLLHYRRRERVCYMLRVVQYKTSARGGSREWNAKWGTAFNVNKEAHLQASGRTFVWGHNIFSRRGWLLGFGVTFYVNMGSSSSTERPYQAQNRGEIIDILLARRRLQMDRSPFDFHSRGDVFLMGPAPDLFWVAL